MELDFETDLEILLKEVNESPCDSSIELRGDFEISSFAMEKGLVFVVFDIDLVPSDVRLPIPSVTSLNCS